MSQYKVIIKEEAQADLKYLLRHEPKAYQKAIRFIGELYDHLFHGNICKNKNKSLTLQVANSNSNAIQILCK